MKTFLSIILALMILPLNLVAKEGGVEQNREEAEYQEWLNSDEGSGFVGIDEWHKKYAKGWQAKRNAVDEMPQGRLRQSMETVYGNTIKDYHFAKLKMLAEDGDVEAMCCVGRCYRVGDGIACDIEQSSAWTRKAASKGCLVAKGICHQFGYGVERNDKEAFECYKKAAEQGSVVAMNHVGYCFYEGIGCASDKQTAQEWYLKGAKHGDAMAMLNLGHNYLNGTGNENDRSVAVDWYEKSAKLGCTLAMVRVGYCYRYGWGVARNASTAVRWFELAASNQNVGGMHELGLCYETGSGVVKDMEKAGVWYRKAAELGYAWAMCSYGVYLMWGRNSSLSDKEAAFSWFEQAAGKGDVRAKMMLAKCYEKGCGTDQNVGRAEELYRGVAKVVYSKSGNYGVDLEDPCILKYRVSSRTEIETVIRDAASASFSVKGFYLGMKMMDAFSLLRHYFPKGKIDITDNTSDGFNKALIINGLNMRFCDADKNGIVKRISFDRKILKAWYQDSPGGRDEWLRWFAEKNGLAFRADTLEGEKRISNPLIMDGRLLGHSMVSQQSFVCTDRKGVVIRYFGKKTATDLSPHWRNNGDAVAAGTIMAGRDVAKKWPDTGWENEQGGAEGSLRIEMDGSDGEEWTTN